MYGCKYAANNKHSFNELFPDKFFPDNSLTFSKIPDISLTAVKFPDISRFSRQVVTLYLTISIVDAIGQVLNHCMTIRPGQIHSLAMMCIRYDTVVFCL